MSTVDGYVPQPAASVPSIARAKELTLDDLYELGMYELRYIAARIYRRPHGDVGRETLAAVVYAGLHPDEDFIDAVNTFAAKHNASDVVIGELKKLMDEPVEESETVAEDAAVDEEEDQELLNEDPRKHAPLTAAAADQLVKVSDVLAKDTFLRAMHQRFRALYKDAGNRDKARYTLAATAVHRLLQYRDSSITRTLLFSPWEEELSSADIPKAVVDQAASRGWQRDLLNNLENRQVIEIETRGHTTSIRVTKEGAPALGRVLLDIVNESGMGLKWLMWPKEYPPFPLFGENVLQKAVEDAEVADEESEDAEIGDLEPTGELGVLQEVTKQLMGLAGAIGTAVETFAAFEKSLREREEEQRVRADLLLDEMGKVVDRLAGIASRLDSEERAQLRLMSDKLAEMEARNKSLANQFASEARREEKLREEVGALVVKLEKTNAKP